MELSRKFIWVWVDRDKTPEIPKEFNVHAYPTLLTLNVDREMIHRFRGFQQVPEFLGNLREALEGFNLYREGKKWIKLPPREKNITGKYNVSTIPVPSQNRITGMTVLGNDLWVAQEDRLFRLDAKTGKVRDRVKLADVSDLCTDGEVLYVGTYGWTKGDPIRVVDPLDGTVIRKIITRENLKNTYSATNGIAYLNGSLYIKGWNKIHEVDPATGDITRTIPIRDRRRISGMDFDGKDLLVTSQKEILRIDIRTGSILGKISMNYPVNQLGMDGDQILLGEYWTMGFTKDHKKIRIYPVTIEIHRLTPRK